ncbi:sensor histidine kinase [Paenibacillus sp. BAC0078]
MKKSRQVQRSKRINLIFSAIFVTLVLGYAATATSLGGTAPAFLRLTFLFAVTMLALGGVWNRLLRSQISAFIETMDEMIDGAIQGRKPMTPFEETALSSLEHKLMRYIEISRASGLSLETEKNNMKELISNISHQTKTPLSNIMLYSQLLAERPEGSEDTRFMVEQIQTQSEKLDWLISSLVKLSRLESGMITLNSKTNSVLRTVNRAINQIHTRAENKQISIHVDCDPIIKARHDLSWTGEALFNLLENSVKYTRPGGNITIQAASNEMFTRIDISDSGIGIPEDELEHIFKRFYRGQAAREYEGVGIGLFLARKIITLQGGFIAAASESGKGTVISIFLPQL